MASRVRCRRVKNQKIIKRYMVWKYQKIIKRYMVMKQNVSRIHFYIGIDPSQNLLMIFDFSPLDSVP